MIVFSSLLFHLFLIQTCTGARSRMLLTFQTGLVEACPAARRAGGGSPTGTLSQGRRPRLPWPRRLARALCAAASATPQLPRAGTSPGPPWAAAGPAPGTAGSDVPPAPGVPPRAPRAAPFSTQGGSSQDTSVKTAFFFFLEFRSAALGKDDGI